NGTYCGCVVGEICNKQLIEFYEESNEIYTYRLGSMSYGIMPPGTSVGVDGYSAGIPILAGEYSFEICVINAENIISCNYPSINVVSDESELGQNSMYTSEEEEDEIIKVTVLKSGSAPAARSLMYIEEYNNIENCTETQCIAEFPKDNYIVIKANFLSDVYFAEWQGTECYLGGLIDNYNENITECGIELIENITLTAILNKRPNVKITSSDCVFDRYHPDDSTYADYSDSKSWGYHTFTFSGTALGGSIGSVLKLLFTNFGTATINCGSWTKETLNDEIVCVRKSLDPESTTFSVIINDFWTQGYVTPWEIRAIVEESEDYTYAPYAIDIVEQECEW
ncbi:MAG: hypothetical protein PHN56_00185, partial [Candidatus Nanoarchaeia archaeon]|nr:hypothetical protein [Candidatus Nanoarchaeia archaeon]